MFPAIRVSAREVYMFEREAVLCRFMLEYFRGLVADIPQEQLTKAAAPGANPPAWELGHLAICADYALKILGQPPRCRKAWYEDFGPGSAPVAKPERVPGRDELVSAITSGYEAAIAALPKADPEVLRQPNPIPFMKDTPIRTNEQLLAHLLTTHLAAHIGHLSVWRRAMGKPPLF
jgi:hypothetical protein